MSDDSTPTVRLNRFLAQSGVASRRGADTLIAEGRVRVDGVVAKPGTQVGPNAVVTVNGVAVDGVAVEGAEDDAAGDPTLPLTLETAAGDWILASDSD